MVLLISDEVGHFLMCTVLAQNCTAIHNTSRLSSFLKLAVEKKIEKEHFNGEKYLQMCFVSLHLLEVQLSKL